MAGTVTLTEERLAGGNIFKVMFTWLSSAGGAADGVTANRYTGIIERVVQIPDSGGTTPTTLWDCTVLDSDGADVLIGLGANLSETAITQKVAADKLATVANTTLTLAVTNAGNAKGGKTILYIRVR